MNSAVLQLATVQAAQCGLGNRVPPRRTEIHDDRFWEGYDSATLIYDCFWQAAQRRVRLVCPKLLNFEAALMGAEFRLDGRPIVPKLSRFTRYDTVDLFVSERPTELTITIGGHTVCIAINPDQTPRYKGRNVLYTMLKDEPIAWVRDWITAHCRNHGADAVLIANNGSTTYTSKALAAAITQIPGIQTADVVDVPLPYAPHIASSSKIGRASFLQTACLNLVRDRFLMRARAVLQCDVDELVDGPEGQSVFDATVGSRLGYVTFSGTWVYPQEALVAPVHASHIRSDLGAATCAPKYCVVPDSILGRMSWSVHGLERLNRHWFRPPSAFRFYHCAAINTAWKHKRDRAIDRKGKTDPAIKAFMDRSFPIPDRPA